MSALRIHLPRTSGVAPALLVWTLVLAFIAFLAATYLSDGMPSPYGVCYAGRGRPIPCEIKNGARVTPTPEPRLKALVQR